MTQTRERQLAYNGRSSLRRVINTLLISMLNPLCFLNTTRRVALRIILADRRLNEQYSGVYTRLLEWPGISLNHGFEFVNLLHLALFVPHHDSGIIGEIFSDEVYDRYFTPEKGSIVIDVGAHVGTYTLKAASRVGNTGHVYAIEPSPTSYALLKHNIKINSFKNITPLNIALSNQNGKQKLYLANKPSHATVVNPSNKYVKVDSRKLDDIIQQHTSKRIDIIKIDAEGAEKEILLGALNTLTHSTSKIVVAAYHYPEELDELSLILRKCGFSTKDHNGILYAYKNYKKSGKEF